MSVWTLTKQGEGHVGVVLAHDEAEALSTASDWLGVEPENWERARGFAYFRVDTWDHVGMDSEPGAYEETERTGVFFLTPSLVIA